jgi:hypothetical protein
MIMTDVQYLKFTPTNMQNMFFLNKKCYTGYVQHMILPKHYELYNIATAAACDVKEWRA